MRLSFIIPTRNRHEELARTLEILGGYDTALLGEHAEVIVIDNDSEPPVEVRARSDNGIKIERIRLARNAGAAARNIGAERASGDWLVMLDDDSAPTAGDFGSLAENTPDNLAAIGGEILLPSGHHESGGLPEVIIGCGCMIRRDAFLAVGGYAESFEYYAEEYDLCAKLIAAGFRVTHTRSVRFEHRKVVEGRSFDCILRRLVRNNGWVIARHAPDHLRDEALRAMLERYQTIGVRENTQRGYNTGAEELTSTIDSQPRTPLTIGQWDRFIGLSACRSHLVPLMHERNAKRAALVARGKGNDLIERVVHESGCELAEDGCDADTLVIGTLSPGPMLDAARARDALQPWATQGSVSAISAPVI